MRVLRVDAGDSRFICDEVVEDILFSIYVNNQSLIQVMIYDQYLEELVIGHLFTNNIIQSLDEIYELNIDDTSARVELITDLDIALSQNQKNTILDKASTGRDIPFPRKNNGISELEQDTVNSIMDELNQRGKIFSSTGGTHSALIYNEKMGIIFAEDVGRFNTIDKVVGISHMKNFDLGESILTTSGRLSGEMVIKAAFAGIPVMCSISAPMRTGVRVAEASDMTLIGFARNRRFNVYSGFNRLKASV